MAPSSSKVVADPDTQRDAFATKFVESQIAPRTSTQPETTSENFNIAKKPQLPPQISTYAVGTADNLWLATWYTRIKIDATGEDVVRALNCRPFSYTGFFILFMNDILIFGDNDGWLGASVFAVSGMLASKGLKIDYANSTFSKPSWQEAKFPVNPICHREYGHLLKWKWNHPWWLILREPRKCWRCDNGQRARHS